MRQARAAARRKIGAGKVSAARMVRDTGQAMLSRPVAGNGLGPREVEVLQFVAYGRSRKQIADELYISPLTVHTHLKNIYAKLDVHNCIAAVNAARILGVIG